MKNINLIMNVPLFFNISENDLENCLSCLSAKEKHYLAGSHVFNAGSSITDIGILLTGQLQITRDDLDGRHNILANLTTGSMFGEAYVCAGVRELPVTVTCIKDCDILFINYNHILNICSNQCAFHSTLISNMLKILAAKNIHLNQKLECLEKRTTREKLLSYFNQEALKQRSDTITIHFTRQELADYLCIDRSGMSTELNRLKKEKLIDFDKNTFELFF